MNPKDFVLQAFKGDDEITVRIMADRAADAVETWLTSGIEIAMTRHNGDIDSPKPEAIKPERSE